LPGRLPPDSQHGEKDNGEPSASTAAFLQHARAALEFAARQLQDARLGCAPFLASVHAVPITVDEFVAAQRFYPIVFSVGDQPSRWR
jgi:hypothetical protein